MGAVASVDDRAVLTAGGRRLGEMFQAMLAFIAKAGTARAGKFHRDPPPGPMAKDDPGQSRGDDETQMNDGG